MEKGRETVHGLMDTPERTNAGPFYAYTHTHCLTTYSLCMCTQCPLGITHIHAYKTHVTYSVYGKTENIVKGATQHRKGIKEPCLRT